MVFDQATLSPTLPGVMELVASAGRWHAQDHALMSVIRVVAPSPRRGVLALVGQPNFGISSLPPLPSNLTSFTVLSADLVKSYDQIVPLAVKADTPWNSGNETGRRFVVFKTEPH